ncbi:MAG: hypothetical protein EPN85_11380 [Bacteroidetes bacterium]|nr:MAG: hypothetical protein EPN85_11380 [Bacteroidota bacterium]
MNFFFTTLFCTASFLLCAQDDLLRMLDTVSTGENKHDKVTGMFKTTKIISMQTPQTVGTGELDFRITHRFGNIGKESGGGIHLLYGWDAVADVRFSFDYGITRKLQVGFARNKKNENLDGSLKWRFLEQTLDNKVPLALCAYSMVSLTPTLKSQLYSGADTAWVNDSAKFIHRMVYTHQLVFARKFNRWLSLAITPSYTHRNYVLANINSSNGAVDENGLFSVGTGIRLKVSRSVSILADYFYIMSDYRKDNPSAPYYNPLALGIEIETGGHVFHMNLTNASGIIENYFIPSTTDTWTKGGYKFGFNISRVFQIVNKRKKDDTQ